ncbi:uncharacterized protein LOC127875396 [Dreissena polymorpha]|uniref:SUEL-type lectin domain-containing protein n=1 Tax=Dreissena polymorpha TaxID=45954 RepID=A0A9D4L9P8_DREPO|nr:uncharacterized protein LOC127875396 [Dreissena polymorpha]KAH3853804.1 hypothetical protein DPMN_096339 [Dreissena polymorpha]
MVGNVFSVSCLVIALMTSRHVTGQENDVAWVNRRLTLIKSSIDRDISDMKIQFAELKMTIEQLMVNNASVGSFIVEPLIDYDYGQGKTGVNQREITDLKTKLNAHTSRLDRLSATITNIQVESSEHKRKVEKLVGDKDDEEKRRELINNLKAEMLLQLNADIETKYGDRVNAQQKSFEQTVTVMKRGYRDLKTQVNEMSKFVSQLVSRDELSVLVLDQMKRLSESVISEQNKLSSRIDKAETKMVRLDVEVNKVDDLFRGIDQLKTKTDTCCTALASSIVCEGSSMYLSCPPGQVLYVHSGVYGRTQGSVICPYPQYIRSTNCVSPTSTVKVVNLCNGKNQCSITATNGVFGDPCDGTYKYLEVKYVCF